jgi:ketosteroid isomerase-like protein
MNEAQINEAVTAREKQWMQAWIDKDEARFNDILADDFLLSSARGRFMNKEEWMQAAAGPFTCIDFEWNEIKVRAYGDTAVVNAIVTQQASVGDEDWSGLFLHTDVWVLQDGRWRVVARHGTGPLKKMETA